MSAKKSYILAFFIFIIPETAIAASEPVIDTGTACFFVLKYKK